MFQTILFFPTGTLSLDISELANPEKLNRVVICECLSILGTHLPEKVIKLRHYLLVLVQDLASNRC